jgi:hypothetical protein
MANGVRRGSGRPPLDIPQSIADVAPEHWGGTSVTCSAWIQPCRVFMNQDGWNHNTHYHQRLLQACRGLPPCARRRVRAGRVRAPPGGCRRAGRRDRSRARGDPRARERSSAVSNLQFIEADFIAWAADGEPTSWR